MPLVYLDYNFIATAHDSPGTYKKRLREAAGRLTFVLSRWHHVEMARDEDEYRAYSVADFVDSLEPKWLYDRRSLHLRELKTQLFNSGIWYEIGPPMGTLREMLADLRNTLPSPTPAQSANLVREFRQLGKEHDVAKSLRKNYENQKENRQDYCNGTITPFDFPRLDRAVIRGFMKEGLSPNTPSPFDARLINEFSSTCKKELLRSIALEIAVSRDAWKNNRALSENEFIDLQHMIALPYVDVFVTDDCRLKKIVQRVVPRLPFRTAEITGKAEFDRRLLP
jgi:hypothetical protein